MTSPRSAIEVAAQEKALPVQAAEEAAQAQPAPLREQMPRMRRSGGGSPRRPRASHRIEEPAQEMDLPVQAAKEAAQEIVFPRSSLEKVAQPVPLCE